VVFALAAVSTALSSMFALATAKRAAEGRGPHQLAWSISLVCFAAASAALAVGTSTGWDAGTYRVFYLGGAILSVPWLALGTVFLLFGGKAGRIVRTGLVFFSGLATGVVCTAALEPIAGTVIPVGKDTFESAGPRVLAAIASGVGATVVIVGAIVSGVRVLADHGAPGRVRLATANGLVALGTLVLSSGGLVQGFVGHDEAFALTLAAGIAVIYAGFLVADGVGRPSVVARPGPRAPRDTSTPPAYHSA
jgi:hypothetical protein